MGRRALVLLVVFCTMIRADSAGGRCEKSRACQWNNFKAGIDWSYLDKSTGDCENCKKLCSHVQGCTGYECGQNYCASWMNGKCSKTSVFTSEGITTCTVWNVTSATAPQGSCRHRCGLRDLNKPDSIFKLCSCDRQCILRQDCCRDFYHHCRGVGGGSDGGPGVDYYLHQDPVGVTGAKPLSSGNTIGFHWYYIAPAIMGASITSFCVLFVWFRYRRRRAAAAAASNVTRQFQSVEVISEFDNVAATPTSPNRREGAYAVTVNPGNDNEDDDANLLKPTMTYPMATRVQATVVSDASAYPSDMVVTAASPGADCSSAPDPSGFAL